MPSQVDQYICTKTLGSGVSAKVKLATDTKGTYVAIKIFDKSNLSNCSKVLSTLKHEIDVYKNLDHPYMVRLLDYKENAILVKSDGKQVQVAYIVMELIPGGELFDYVAIRAFSTEVSRYYFKQML